MRVDWDRPFRASRRTVIALSVVGLLTAGLASLAGLLLVGGGCHPVAYGPQTDFDITAENGTVTVTMVDGDRLPADHLDVRTRDTNRSWAVPDGVANASALVGSGAVVTVETPPHRDVWVVWRPGGVFDPDVNEDDCGSDPTATTTLARQAVGNDSERNV